MDQSPSRVFRVNLAQRVVVSIAWGAVLYLVASYLTYRLATTHMLGGDGWFNYAPNGAQLFSADLGGGKSISELIVGTSAVVLWASGSAWLFRDRARSATSDQSGE